MRLKNNNFYIIGFYNEILAGISLFIQYQNGDFGYEIF
jgi:hypothetical protein